MGKDDVRVEGRVEPGGEKYKDEYVIEKILGEHPEEYREELWRGHKGQLYSLFYAARELLQRHVADGTTPAFPEEARIQKLEQRVDERVAAIEEARDDLGRAIAFADPYSPEDVKASKDALHDAEKKLRPFDRREYKTQNGAKSDGDGQ